MAGTKDQAIGLQSIRVQTLLSSASTPQNSLEGLDPTMLAHRSLVWVEANATLYRWDDTSTATANADTVVRPTALSAGDAGRFFRIEKNNSQGLAAPSFFGWVNQNSTPETTTISAQNAVTPLVGSFFAFAFADPDFTVTAAGVVTYNGNKDYLGIPWIQGALDVVGGANQDIRVFVDRNDLSAGISGGDVTTPPVRAVNGRVYFSHASPALQVSNGDFFQIKVVNLTDSSNIATLGTLSGVAFPEANPVVYMLDLNQPIPFA